MNEDNVFIANEDEIYTMQPGTTYSTSTVNPNNYDNDNVTIAYNPFQWYQQLQWSTAPQHLTCTYDLGNIDELKIHIHDKEIKIPVTNDFINNLEKFLKGLTYTEE